MLVRLASLPLPLPVKGLTARRSLLGIDNLISAIIFLLDNQSAVNQTFLVADSAPLTLIEILTMLRKAQGRATVVGICPGIPYSTYIYPVRLSASLGAGGQQLGRRYERS